MKHKTLFLLILAAVLLLSACAAEKTQEPAEEPAPQQTDGPAPQTTEPQEPPLPQKVAVTFTRSDVERADDDGEYLVSCRYQMPIVSTGDDKVDKAVNDTIRGTHETYLDALDRLYNDAKAERAENEYFWGPYGIDRDVYVGRADERVVSLVYLDYYYTGGAHGYTWHLSENYDAATGKLLTLDDLGKTEELAAYAAKRVPELAEESGLTEDFYDDWHETASGLLREGMWTLTGEGLEVYAGEYELGPYVIGAQTFTIPYEELRGMLKKAYLPVERSGDAAEGDALTVRRLSDADTSGMRVDTVVVDEGGEEAFIVPTQTVYDLEVVGIAYYDYNEPVDTQLYYRAGCVTEKDAVCVTSYIPDVQPALAVRCTLADGTVYMRGISQSGEDGHLMLVETSFEDAVDIIDLLPYSVDLDGDGAEETIDYRYSDNAYEDNVYLTVKSGARVYEVERFMSRVTDLCLYDIDGDGRQEIFLCGDEFSDDYVTFCWRFDDGLHAIDFSDGLTSDDEFDPPEEEAMYMPGFIKYFTGGELVMANRVFMLGTYDADMTYAYVDGKIRAVGAVWEVNDFDYELTLKEPLRIETMDGHATLASGTKIRLIATDRIDTVWILTNDGNYTYGWFNVSYKDDDYGAFIDGISEFDYFDGLIYVG